MFTRHRALVVAAFGLAALAWPASALAVAGDFEQPPSSPEAAGTAPRSVAAGDFDGDGVGDLAVANFDSNDVTILLGDGSGDFNEAATSPEDNGTLSPVAVAVGDFNGDGDDDLAVANQGSLDVTILLGDGTGDFTAAASSPEFLLATFLDLVVGDFNGDGDDDLALTTNNFGFDNVRILLGDGAGDFTEPASSPETSGTFAIKIAAGDFNGDGSDDLVTAQPFESEVRILLSDGAGDFTEPASSPEAAGGITPFSVAVGDFNGDGEDDLAVANTDSNDVTILLGDGTGDFTAAASNPQPVGSAPQSLAVGEFNGDGEEDLAVANEDSDNVTILLGDGTGDFTQPATSPEGAGGSPRSIAASDFNGDGQPDLAIANSSDNNVTILLNQTPPPPGPPTPPPPGPTPEDPPPAEPGETEPPPADRTDPNLVLDYDPTQRRGGSFGLQASCDEPCAVVAEANLKTVKVKNGKRLRADYIVRGDGTKLDSARETADLELIPTKKARKKARKALNSGGKAKIKGVVTATDESFNVTKQRFEIKLR